MFARACGVALLGAALGPSAQRGLLSPVSPDWVIVLSPPVVSSWVFRPPLGGARVPSRPSAVLLVPGGVG